MMLSELAMDACRALLARNRLARLACSLDDQPYLIPIFYHFDDDSAYAFSLPGRKIETMRANPKVALLVEETGEKSGWTSVVAEGLFEELPNRIGSKRVRDHAWSLLSAHSNWWQPGALKPGLPPLQDERRHLFFRVRIHRMSGRSSSAA